MFSRLTGQLRRALRPGASSPDSIPERRDGLRVAQQARTITVLTAGVRTAFRLRNISARGASGEADVELRDGAQVVLEFERGQEVLGAVKWTQGALAGIAFASPVALDIIRYRADPDEPRRTRATRYNVARPATIMIGTLSRAAVVRNISATGMMLESAFTLEPGQRIRVTCGPMTLDCQVRWSRHGMAGLSFRRPISLDAFSGEDASVDEG